MVRQPFRTFETIASGRGGIAVLALLALALAAGCARAHLTPEPLSIESLCGNATDRGSHGRHHPVLGRYVDDRIAGDSTESLVDVGALGRDSDIVNPSAGSKPLQTTRALRSYIRDHGGGVIAYWADLTIGTSGAPIDGTAFADGDDNGKGRAAFVRARGAQAWSFAHVDEPYAPVCE
ncbi:MAG TPA: hypothetical protein VKT51_13245 [Candidatus Eremiobacteraceae bacterium]|nr:hypothetical protein [Candidatus Eremiobacteraceae bacterium]